MFYYGVAAIFPLIMWYLSDGIAKAHHLSDRGREKLNKQFTILAILPIFLLFVLRDKYIGADTIGYVRFFQVDIRRFSFYMLFQEDVMRFEIGFRLYVKLISLITNNYTIYFLINGIIIFGTLLCFSFKYTKNPFLFFFLFITLGTYSFLETGLRQALAMMICLWSVDFIKDRKPIRFILTVILAYFFHKSAMIFVILYPLCNIKKHDYMIFVYSFFSFVLLIGFSTFQGFFNSLLGYEYEIEETNNGGIFMMVLLILFSFSFYLLHNKKEEEKTLNVILHLSLLTLMFWLLRLVSRTAERICYYYIYGLYIYFSQAARYDRDFWSSLLKGLLILACFALFIYRNIGVNYSFFW